MCDIIGNSTWWWTFRETPTGPIVRWSNGRPFFSHSMVGAGSPSAGHFRTTVLAAGFTTRRMLFFFCVHLGGPAVNTQTDTEINNYSSNSRKCKWFIIVNNYIVHGSKTSLKQRRVQLCEHFFTQIEEPQHKLHKLLPKPRTATYNTRCRTRYPYPRVKTNWTKNCFIKGKKS